MGPVASPETADVATSADRLRARAEARRRRILASQEARSRQVLGALEPADRVAAHDPNESTHVSPGVASRLPWSGKSQSSSSPWFGLEPGAEGAHGEFAGNKRSRGDGPGLGQVQTPDTEATAGTEFRKVATERRCHEGRPPAPSGAEDAQSCAAPERSNTSHSGAAAADQEPVCHDFPTGVPGKQAEGLAAAGRSAAIGQSCGRIFRVALPFVIGCVVRPLGRLKRHLVLLQCMHGALTFTLAFGSAVFPPLLSWDRPAFCFRASSSGDDLAFSQNRAPSGSEVENTVPTFLLTVLARQPLLVVVLSSLVLVAVDSGPAVLQWYDNREKVRQGDWGTPGGNDISKALPISGKSYGKEFIHAREEKVNTVPDFAAVFPAAILWVSRLLSLLQWARAVLRVMQQVAMFVALYCFFRCVFVWLADSSLTYTRPALARVS